MIREFTADHCPRITLEQQDDVNEWCAEHGIDPSLYVRLVFGGDGPLHFVRADPCDMGDLGPTAPTLTVAVLRPFPIPAEVLR